MRKPDSPIPLFLLLLAFLLASIFAVDAHDVVCKCYRVHGHHRTSHSGHHSKHKGGQSNGSTSSDNSAVHSHNSTGTGNQSSSSQSSPSSSSSSDVTVSHNSTGAGSETSSSSPTEAGNQTSSLPSPPSSSNVSTSYNSTTSGNQTSSSSSASSSIVDGNSHAHQRPIGMCFGHAGGILPSPSVIVQLLKSHGISKVRLFVPIPGVLSALKGTGIQIMVGVPNEKIIHLSLGGVDAARHWLKASILKFVDPKQVCYLAVGNEVLQAHPLIIRHLVPAMYNLHKALQTSGLDATIKLSSPCASHILGVQMPPSAGAFAPFSLPVIRPMLKFLSETGAPFMVNMYPFLSFIHDPMSIALNFCLFRGNAPPMLDGGRHYTNMLEVMVDALVTAMEREGFGGIRVMVTATGWPASGDNAATPANAAAYVEGLMQRASNGMATPKRPNQAVEVFLSDMFKENAHGGKAFEKHFGIFNNDGSPAININSFT
ncbi:hypothetical protein BHM03_00025806 [Ensete ventricosum]|nr:hypothetical protein BHM03_00025806 [Ensete ventricosum]